MNTATLIGMTIGGIFALAYRAHARSKRRDRD